MFRISMPPLEFENINEIPLKTKIKKLSKTKGILRMEKKKLVDLIYNKDGN